MMMKAIQLYVLSSLFVLSKTYAWSPPSNQQQDRKVFLENIVKSSLVTSGLVNPSLALAAPIPNNDNKIFYPPPKSQNGKVHIITGASTGLGLESAKRIAAAGATVILTSRTVKKGEQAVGEVKRYLEEKNIENPDVFFLTLDLDDFDSIKSFPERYNTLTSNKRISVLMNNAGVTGIPEREITKNGFERTFQSNHLGPFLLTTLLFPYLSRDGARVVNVSSLAHKFSSSGLDLDNLNSEKSYVANGWAAYGQSKLENILFTQELQRKADAAGLDWFVTVSLHPGVIGTDIWRSTKFVSKMSPTSFLFYNNMLSIEEGANTQVCLATEKSLLAKGKFYDESGKILKLDKFALDSVKAQELWQTSENMTGVKFEVV